MKKVLIIGAKGMLGQALTEAFLKDKQYSVSAWDKEDLDITKKEEVNQKISGLKPDIIINSAAYNAVDDCEKRECFELAKKVNGKAPGYLAKIAKKIGAIFIHYSTDYVFDGLPRNEEPAGCTHCCASCQLYKAPISDIGFDENAEPNPISLYGKSKLLGEKEVQKIKGNYYLIRLSKLFGKPAKSPESKKSFFDIMLELSKNKKEIKVVDDETSCFTYAPDLAQRTKEIIESKMPFGIYHIVNSGPCTWYKAVLELYKEVEVKTKVIPIPSAEYQRAAKRPSNSTLLNTKLKPLRNYKQALKEYLKYNKH